MSGAARCCRPNPFVRPRTAWLLHLLAKTYGKSPSDLLNQNLDDFLLDVGVLVQGLTKEHEAQERAMAQAKARTEFDRQSKSNLR